MKNMDFVKSGRENFECSACRETPGKVECSACKGYPDHCKVCGGSGKIKCSKCNGHGRVGGEFSGTIL